MNIALRIIISLVIALIVATLYTGLTAQDGFNLSFDLPTLLAFAVATVATALVTSIGQTSTGTISSNSEVASNDQDFAYGTENREQGIVKWFNYSKGFGFITRDQGDDVFVHYRSIRGNGRRSLHEGQRVEFTATEGEKGLQAEDVVILKSDS